MDLSERRWQAGDNFWCDGIRYRVVEGRKKPGDLRLERRIDGEWQPVRMESGFMLADFFFENEHVVFPRADGYRGGYEYLKELHNAARHGWEATQRKLRGQQQRLRSALGQCAPIRRREDGTR